MEEMKLFYDSPTIKIMFFFYFGGLARGRFAHARSKDPGDRLLQPEMVEAKAAGQWDLSGGPGGVGVAQPEILLRLRAANQAASPEAAWPSCFGGAAARLKEALRLPFPGLAVIGCRDHL